MVKPVRYTMIAQSGRRPTYEVIGHFADGQSRTLGHIWRRKVRHLSLPDLPRYGWQSPRSNSCHPEAWEAAVACGWDGIGPHPFPVDPRYRALVAVA